MYSTFAAIVAHCYELEGDWCMPSVLVSVTFRSFQFVGIDFFTLFRECSHYSPIYNTFVISTPVREEKERGRGSHLYRIISLFYFRFFIVWHQPFRIHFDLLLAKGNRHSIHHIWYDEQSNQMVMRHQPKNISSSTCVSAANIKFDDYDKHKREILVCKMRRTRPSCGDCFAVNRIMFSHPKW